MSTPREYQSSEPADRKYVYRGLATIAIAIALTLAVLFLRFYRLGELPTGIQSDEGPDGVYALQVLDGVHSVFFPEKGSGREAVGVYAIALATYFLGSTLLAFHFPTALASSGTVFVVFWLGQLLFGRDEKTGQPLPWRGLLVGSVGAGLMAVSIGQTFLARAGLRANYLPLFLSLSLALLWWAWPLKGRSGVFWWRVALAGACAGLLQYTYLAARITPVLYILFGLSFLLPFRTTLRTSDRSVLVKRYLPWVGMFAGMAGLVAAPLLIYFAQLPEDFSIRSRQLWLFTEGQGNPIGAFLRNAWEHILVLGFQGDQHLRYNFAGQPMLNPWQTIFFWVGVVIAVYQWQRSPVSRLLLLWLGVLILPAMLADTRGEGPNSLRMIGAAPAIYLLIGSGMWETYRFLWARRSAPKLRECPVLPSREATFAVIGTALVAVLILAQGVVTYRSFFWEWAGNPAFDRAYHAEWAEAAKVLNEQQSEEEAIYLIPYPLHNEHFSGEHFGFEYLYQGAAPAYILAATTPHHLAKKVETILSTDTNFPSVTILDWNNELVGGDARAEEHTVSLLEKIGRLSNSQKHGSFELHTFTDITIDRPLSYYERLHPLTIHYDKGISLLGFALGQGRAQLPSQRSVHVGNVQPIWVALQWQAAPELDIDFSASLRLYDAQGGSVLQKDFVLKDASPSPTSHWKEDETVDTLNYLDLPTDLLSGDFELRLVVYDFKTFQPTVELGVWEPETVLASLRLEAAD